MYKPSVSVGLLTAREMAAKVSYPHEDEYTSLTDLNIKIPEENDATFFICFWLYILGSYTTPPVTIIQQRHTDIEGNAPFLLLNKEKKLMLFPFKFLLDESCQHGTSSSWSEVPASTEIEYSFNKWVHVGCEVSLKSVRIYIDGVLEGEKSLLPFLKNGSSLKNLRGTTLGGASAENGTVQGYVHYVRFILPLKSAIQDHIIKNPPIELSIDTSGITEIEEDEDGVWSVVGGKASCRRNFNLDVVLLDGLGHPVDLDMEVVASLLYADNGAPVEKPSDAEAPLLTNYDGIEFASFLRPSKLLLGRASFKLKISQLSSKCDNRLFRVRFDVLKSRRYPFLEAYTSPIRCISRSRNTRPSSVVGKKSTSASNIHDKYQLLEIDDGCPEAQQNNEDGHLAKSPIPELRCSTPPKRTKAGSEKQSVRVQADSTFGRQYDGCKSNRLSSNQVGYVHGEGVKGRVDNLEGTDNTLSDSESVQARDPASKKVESTRNPVPDFIIFKYCLGGMNERSLLLKEVTTFATDEEMICFGQQVFLYTGCSHQWYQISIAKRLLREGSDAWNLISKGNSYVHWKNAVLEIGEQFKRISRCCTRHLVEQVAFL
ncbi:hypothetical protein AQUCO_05900010v1 [Aquilegia coerulea]|uniref:Uncharacterized protein n=1 Tax=Aquilegia coerulea TaxID=218851 RepID=A0A2G5CDZ7_AQUCA|nr:hypothetical protein AQUCO_05900010v1 [Aquilegia coerulea]